AEKAKLSIADDAWSAQVLKHQLRIATAQPFRLDHDVAFRHPLSRKRCLGPLVNILSTLISRSSPPRSDLTMYLSALLTSLPDPFENALTQLAAMRFTHVDVVALVERPAAHLEALAASGLIVPCASIGKGLPDAHTLDAADIDLRRGALDAMKRQIADAAR